MNIKFFIIMLTSLAVVPSTMEAMKARRAGSARNYITQLTSEQAQAIRSNMHFPGNVVVHGLTGSTTTTKTPTNRLTQPQTRNTTKTTSTTDENAFSHDQTEYNILENHNPIGADYMSDEDFSRFQQLQADEVFARSLAQNSDNDDVTAIPNKISMAQAQIVQWPADLSRAQGTIYQVPVLQQSAAQCGSRAVTNALAVQSLFNSIGQLITPENIQNESKKWLRILIDNDIDDIKLRELAHQNGLKNAYVVGKNNDNAYDKNELPYSFKITSSDYAELLDNIVYTIKTTQSGMFHFLFNAGDAKNGHWIVVSLIKQEGRDAAVLYMDSGNAALDNKNPTLIFIYYLQKIDLLS